MPENLDDGVGQGSPVPPSPAPEYPAYPAPTQLPQFPPPPTLLPESPGTLESPVVLPDYPPPQPAPDDPDFAKIAQPSSEMPSAGMASISSIETWPPLISEVEKSYPLSPRTGEPKRPAVLIAAIIFCWLSVAWTIVAFSGWWWQASHIDTFTSSARLLTWTHPDPVSALAIVMVILIGLIGLLMVAAAGTAAYNSWVGRSWIRVGGWICVAVTGLSFLLTWWFSIAMIPLVIGVGLLWLPTVNAFFAAMDSLTTTQPVEVPTTGIRYGPQTLVGRR